MRRLVSLTRPAIALALVALSACTNPDGSTNAITTGTVLGAATGAAAGNAVRGNSRGTVIGALAGASAGLATGAVIDGQRRQTVYRQPQPVYQQRYY